MRLVRSHDGSRPAGNLLRHWRGRLVFSNGVLLFGPVTVTAELTREAGLPAGVRVIPPLGYLDFIALEASARLVLTDSGGVQEETTVLGVPCLTLRDNTERPITLTEGTNQLVGRDPSRIVKAAHEVLAAPPRSPRRPALWDGKAGQRIAAALVEGHDARSW